MKKFIINLSLVIFLTSSLLSKTHNSKSYNLIECEELRVSYLDSAMFSMFDTAIYDGGKSRLEFEMNNQILMIQIFNKQLDLEFVLPVDSKKVILQKSLFDLGHNRLGFIVEGSSSINFTEVFIF